MDALRGATAESSESVFDTVNICELSDDQLEDVIGGSGVPLPFTK